MQSRGGYNTCVFPGMEPRQGVKETHANMSTQLGTHKYTGAKPTQEPPYLPLLLHLMGIALSIACKGPSNMWSLHDGSVEFFHSSSFGGK